MRIDLRPSLPFVPPVRFFFTFCSLAWSVFAAVPPELTAALKNFRSDVPPGWSFTQTTAAEGKSTVEHSDAAKPDFDRWSLVQKDGHAPTADDLREYAEARSRRSRGGTAPKLVEQLDLPSLETVTSDAAHTTYRCRLRPGEARDNTAPFLRATLVLHRPSGTLLSIELNSVSAFSPTFGIKIEELKTRMTYSLPDGEKPGLPLLVATRVRGRAFFFKSLDAEMTVTFSDFARPVKRTP